MNLSMYGVLHEIEQAHADAGQFTDMLAVPRVDGQHKLAASHDVRPSDRTQSDDPPALQKQTQYYLLWLYEQQRRTDAEESRRQWRGLAIALAAALVVVIVEALR